MAAGIRSKTQTQLQAPTQTRVVFNSRRGSLETSEKPNIAMTILKELRDFKVQIRQERKDTREEIKLEIGELSKKIDEERIVIDDKELEVFRDIPANILKKRQEYRFLTQLLQRLNIRYRWERIEGISLTYGQKRYRINSIEKAKDIYKKLIARKKKEEEKEAKEKKKDKEKRSVESVFSEESHIQETKGDKELDVQEVSLIDLDPSVQDISRDSNSEELY
ncbi:uncharacterized protein LOC121918061 [Sceloporus undulatus]|uniref:uncharacterized protein LOC121918061 n=1 Tax=Sceloporus undulatus TaxID=8520 RepID=UPI001C4AC969|nr:uncharacterized protein LOC121918061 [Sceloporus undulatus]